MSILLATTTATAHDHSHPELNGWYQSLHSGKGPCCDGSDATRVEDADWESRDGHYRVRLPGACSAEATCEGVWVDVPDSAVVDGPNRDGRTLVWPLRGYMGMSVRCFMPGSMT